MAAIMAIIGPKFGHHQDRVEQPKRRTSSSTACNGLEERENGRCCPPITQAWLRSHDIVQHQENSDRRQATGDRENEQHTRKDEDS
ncbi:hypothetical protein H106_03280 [Trichophyton rubrum CBS 735.88]|nr:hypothetical protein H106_03280 [Trichophyton rubrum CBS 735.88]